MAELENPYQPPISNVDDVLDAGRDPGAYIEGGRAVETARGWTWIKEGFGYFRRQAGMWVVLTFIFFMLLIGMQLVPVVGSIAFMLLMPVLVAGFMTGCRTIEAGGELELAHLFAGFRRNVGQLMLISVIAAVLMMAAMIPVWVVLGVTAAASANASVAGVFAFSTGVLLAILVSLALLIPINMAVWFAPALVVLQDQSAPRALAQSFRGCLRNIVPFLVYAAILFCLAMIAAIPLGLGWFVLAPIVICSVYAAYRDIYFR